jgi:3D (Asp-Asp-Asp) domain-containing protein
VEKVKCVETITTIKPTTKSRLVKASSIPTKSKKSTKVTKSKQETKVTKKTKTDKTNKKTFRVTAYCACAKCCGKWASKRPLDNNGKPIVYGASGKKLISNYSCAAPLPFGTKIKLDGIGTVEVHDRTANWVVNKYGKNIIDIYMTNHKEASKFALKKVKGVVYYD